MSIIKKSSKALAIILASIGLISASLNIAADQLIIDGGTTKDLIPVQKPIAMLAPNGNLEELYGKNHLRVTAWVDHKDATYRLGDTVKFYVRANKDCYITLLDIGTTGKVHIIFPNNFQETNFVKAGKTIIVPQAIDYFDFKVTGKRGNEIVKVIATIEPIEIIPKNYLKNAGPYSEVNSKDIEVVATGIDQYLNDPDQETEWDEYTKKLRIE